MEPLIVKSWSVLFLFIFCHTNVLLSSFQQRSPVGAGRGNIKLNTEFRVMHWLGLSGKDERELWKGGVFCAGIALLSLGFSLCSSCSSILSTTLVFLPTRRIYHLPTYYCIRCVFAWRRLDRALNFSLHDDHETEEEVDFFQSTVVNILEERACMHA